MRADSRYSGQYLCQLHAISIISASSYSNTAPLIWSFLYGSNRGKYEVILDTAPARSAELLANDEVDAALVPVIAAQLIDNISLVPGVCVGAQEKVRSVCLVTDGKELQDVRSVSLDVSSKTSVVLTKIIFREFLGFEPTWIDAKPDVEAMLKQSDCALLIGDPALAVNSGFKIQNSTQCEKRITNRELRKYDLVELWRKYTNFGFVFAMWMTRRTECDIDFAAARDEGIAHAEEIISNYEGEIALSRDELKKYLTENISYSISESMKNGLELYFNLAAKNKLTEGNRDLVYL
ncbi:MAG: menaquinone biosynthesis protein [Pyrinomonadaceae bacterium]